MPKSDKQIRLDILKFLYRRAKINPHVFVSGEEIFKQLRVSKNRLKFNIFYLEDGEYIRLEKFLGGKFLARITVYGIDVVERSRK